MAAGKTEQETDVSGPPRVSKRLIAGAVLSGTLSILDLTIVVPILTNIGSDLGGGTAVSWLIAAYLVASTVSIPIWGRVMDIRGERLAMYASLTIFTLGTLAAVFAPSLLLLIVARVVQGIGVGGIVPVGQAVLASRCTKEQRAKMQIYYQMAYGIAALAGPIVGASLAATSWRWAFVLILPFCLVTGLLLAGFLKSAPSGKQVRPFDTRGSVLTTVTLVAILLGVERLSVGGWLPWVAFAVGAATLPVLVRHLLSTTDGLIPQSLLRNRTIAMASMIMLLIGFAQFAFLSYLPALALGYDGAMNSGISVVPLMLPYVLLGAASGFLALRFGSRVLAIFASVGTVVASATVALSGAIPGLFAGALIMGIALAMTMIPMLLICQHVAPAQDVGSATSLPVLTRNFGGALGAAVIAVTADALIPNGGTVAEGLAPAFWVIAAVGLLALIPAILLPRRAAEKKLIAEREAIAAHASHV